MTSYALSQRNVLSNSWAREALLIVGASFIITLFSSIAIPLPFTPVCIGTQAQVVLLLGALLGSRRAGLAVLLFLIEGACGLPVFSEGRSGILHFFGPRGGYLIGYLVGAYATGFILERAKERTAAAAFKAMAFGNALIFLCGFSTLALLIGAKSAFLLGVLPFLLGDFLKLIIAAKTFKAIVRY